MSFCIVCDVTSVAVTHILQGYLTVVGVILKQKHMSIIGAVLDQLIQENNINSP